IVTLSVGDQETGKGRNHGVGSGRGDSRVPVRHRFRSEASQGRSGDEMALKVEGIVDGGVDTEKSLCGASGFEPLHLAFASSHDLMRVLGAIVHSQPLLMPAGPAKSLKRGAV